MFDLNNLDEEEIHDAAHLVELALRSAQEGRELADNPNTTREDLAEALADMADFVALVFGASQMVMEVLAVQNNVELS